MKTNLYLKWFFSLLPALLPAFPLLSADFRGGGRAAAPAPHAAAPAHAAPAPRAAPPMAVDRAFHGSVRHAETPVEHRPAINRVEPERHVEVNRAPERRVEVHPDVRVHRDVDVDFHRDRRWHDFAFGRRLAVLPFGFLTLNIGGVPYYYDDGIYYQPIDGQYQEVYPPVGADLAQPPDGAIQVYAGGQTYYYAGGAFYVQQPDGSFVIAPTPIGVVVPELPPGAAQVWANGAMAYQFNGIYYRPVFVNGVTQYQTFAP